MGASFKNVDQIYHVSMVGCHTVKVTYEVLKALMRHPMTERGVLNFEKDGEHLYDVDF